MIWFLVLTMVYGSGTDAGIVSGYVPEVRTVQIRMTSEEACEKAAAINSDYRAECWAKKDASLKVDQNCNCVVVPVPGLVGK